MAQNPGGSRAKMQVYRFGKKIHQFFQRLLLKQPDLIPLFNFCYILIKRI